MTEPNTGPSIWSIKSHSSHQSAILLKSVSADISWPILVVPTFASCSKVVRFQPLNNVSLRTEHLVLLDTPGRLLLWTMAALEGYGSWWLHV